MPFDFSPGYTVPREDLEAARVLRDAARLVTGGWWRSCGSDDRGTGSRYCAALSIVHGGGGWWGDNPTPQIAFMQFLGLPKTDDPHAIYVWNDAPGRTKAEVISALTGCADWLEAGRPALHGAGR